MFDNYPRKRPALPPAYEAVYVQHYTDNRAGRGGANSMAQRAEGWMHNRIAQRGKPGDVVLDFGAGNLNHFHWEKGFSQYDVVEPFAQLLADAPAEAKPSHVYEFVHDVPDGA